MLSLNTASWMPLSTEFVSQLPKAANLGNLGKNVVRVIKNSSALSVRACQFLGETAQNYVNHRGIYGLCFDIAALTTGIFLVIKSGGNGHLAPEVSSNLDSFIPAISALAALKIFSTCLLSGATSKPPFTRSNINNINRAVALEQFSCAAHCVLCYFVYIQ